MIRLLYPKLFLILMEIDEKQEIAIIRAKCNLDNKDVLEIGCGDGRLSFYLAEFAKNIVAIDPDIDKIKKASDRLSSLKIYNLNFYIGKGEELIFSSDSFDAIFYSLSFHHVPIDQQNTAIKEAHRVLKNNGSLILYEPLKDGEMQKLFLLFEDELERMEMINKMIQKNDVMGIFSIIQTYNFRLAIKFVDFDELVSCFSNLYSQDAVINNLDKIKDIIKQKLNDKPLIIYDDLFLVFMMSK